MRIKKSINLPDCPSTEDACKCWQDTDQFKVVVSCGEWKDKVQPVYVHTYNLEDEEIEVIRVYADGCDPLYSPVRCQGMCVTLSEEHPDIMLTVPGTYLFKTLSGEPFDNDDFGVEKSAVSFEFADLWLKQQALCCCIKGNT